MKYLLLIFILFLPSSELFSQESDTSVAPDSLNLISPSDTLSADTVTARRYDVDTVIYAEASDSLIFKVKERKMDIYGQASLQYKETDLKSANIFVDFETSNLEAVGIPSDTAAAGYLETPVLKEGADTYEGIRIKYNFRNKQGFIAAAGTESEGAYYTGEKIKKVDEEVYFIQNGIYTTCDVDTPHYHFFSPHMKVIHKEQIVAEWIFLNFGGVPFPIPLPFAVFPIQSGRRSGLIPPVYGEDGTYGTYFSRFGYFWAMSDYMDLGLTADYYTRGSYGFEGQYRYAQRYNFTGSINGEYNKRFNQEPGDPDRTESYDWRIRINHNQNITPTMRFDANLEFLTNNFLNRSVSQYSDLLRNEVISNANFFKSWEESGNSLSLSYQRSQNLQQNIVNEILPSLRFNMSQKYPFKREAGAGARKWYEQIGYTYNNQFLNRRNKKGSDLEIRGGIEHNFSTSASPKIGYFSITPRVSYQERWYNKRVEISFAGLNSRGQDSLLVQDVKEINFVRTYNLGVGATTKFYGIFQPNAFGISAIRHTVNPTVTYNFQPDYSGSFWGYYGTYTNSRGEQVKYNKYQNEVFGGPSAGEQQNISFSLANIFEMKTAVDPTDTTDKEEKIQLLNLSAGLSYNFAADSVRFSPLNVNFRTQMSDWLSFDGNARYTLYEVDERSGRNLRKFLIDAGKGLFRLTNFSFTVSTSLSGERLKPVQREETPFQDEFELGQAQNPVYRGLYEEKEADFTIPWDVSLSYNYNYNEVIPGESSVLSNLRGGFNFNLTPAWKFSFSGSYDIQKREFAAPEIRISRDLHCWIMNFTWHPIGIYRGYRFEIRVKAPQLQDLKVTKQDQFFSGR